MLKKIMNTFMFIGSDLCWGFLPISRFSTFNIYFSVLFYVTYLAVFSSKPSFQTNVLNDEIALG